METPEAPAGPDLTPVLAATTRWLLGAYPPTGGPLRRSLAGVQARQATTLAGALRYPTETDAGLVLMLGPGGSARLDWIVGADAPEYGEAEYGEAELSWRSWVDEVLASWAACLLSDGRLAMAAVSSLRCPEVSAVAFQRLVSPSHRDRNAAALLRHPDLVAPVADLHRASLLAILEPPRADAA